MKQGIFVFDLDGTLANIEHRRYLVEKKARSGISPNWPLFFKECVNDKPIQPVISLFRHVYFCSHPPKLEIWSGRSDEVYWDTVGWLQRFVFQQVGADLWNNPAGGDRYVRLRMRPQGDTSPDTSLKMRFLMAAEDEGLTVELAIDDRQRVVDMWRGQGIVCLQCAEGKY